MAYSLPKIDFKAEIKALCQEMKEMEANGEFDNISITEEDFNDSMTIEEAWSYYNDRKYQKDAQFNEESLRAQGIREDAIHQVMFSKALYNEAVETLKKAGLI